MIRTSNVWAWIDNFKFQILTFPNQKVADKKWKYFSPVLIFEIKFSTYCDNSDTSSYDELKVELSPDSNLHRKLSGRQLKKKTNIWIRI